jgi:hypothetical protein
MTNDTGNDLRPGGSSFFAVRASARDVAAGTRRVADRAALWNGILEKGAFG